MHGMLTTVAMSLMYVYSRAQYRNMYIQRTCACVCIYHILCLSHSCTHGSESKLFAWFQPLIQMNEISTFNHDIVHAWSSCKNTFTKPIQSVNRTWISNTMHAFFTYSNLRRFEFSNLRRFEFSNLRRFELLCTSRKVARTESCMPLPEVVQIESWNQKSVVLCIHIHTDVSMCCFLQSDVVVGDRQRHES